MKLIERVKTADYTTERYSDVNTLIEEDILRRKAVWHSIRRPISPLEFKSLQIIRRQVLESVEPDYSLVDFQLRVNTGYGPFAEEIYGTPGDGHTFLRLNLYGKTADITFWDHKLRI